MAFSAGTGLLAAGPAGFVLLGDSWWQRAVAAFLAIAFAQVGFVAHDAGHRLIFTSRRANDTAGIMHANLAVGLGLQLLGRPPQPSPRPPQRSPTSDRFPVGGTVRIGAVVVAIWLIIRVLATTQRGYFSSSGSNCAKASSTAVTIVAGPLNYVGVNPKINCNVPQPSN